MEYFELDPTLVLIANVLIIISAVIAVASVVAHLRVRWRASTMGRHLMAYMSVIAAVLTLASARVFFADTWWFQDLRLATFIGVPIVLGRQLWLQIQAQRGKDLDQP